MTDAFMYEQQDNEARELIRRIQSRRDKNGTAMLELVQMYQPYVQIICKPFVRVGIIERDEVLSLSFLATSAACKRFDRGRGPYVILLKMCLLRELTMCASESGAVRLPLNLFLRLQKYRRTRSSLGQRLGRDPTPWEIAEVMETTAAEIDALQKINYIISPLRLDAPVNNDTDEEITLADSVPSPVSVSETAEAEIYDGQLHDAVEEMLEDLPSKERDVIVCRYFENLTLSQTGEKIGISREAARAAEGRAMRRLRKNSVRLESFIEDRNLFNGTGFVSWTYTGTSAPELAAIKFEQWQNESHRKDKD